MKALEEKVGRLTDSLLGTLDGVKPGVISLLHSVRDQSEENGQCLRRLTDQMDALRLDRAKVAGIIVTVVFACGLIYKFVLK